MHLSFRSRLGYWEATDPSQCLVHERISIFNETSVLPTPTIMRIYFHPDSIPSTQTNKQTICLYLSPQTSCFAGGSNFVSLGSLVLSSLVGETERQWTGRTGNSSCQYDEWTQRAVSTKTRIKIKIRDPDDNTTKHKSNDDDGSISSAASGPAVPQPPLRACSSNSSVYGTTAVNKPQCQR